MTKHLHVCAISCRPEVVFDVISDGNVKTIEGNPVVNFEVASSNSFRDIKKNHFVMAEAAARDGVTRYSRPVYYRQQFNSCSKPR